MQHQRTCVSLCGAGLHHGTGPAKFNSTVKHPYDKSAQTRHTQKLFGSRASARQGHIQSGQASTFEPIRLLLGDSTTVLGVIGQVEGVGLTGRL